LLVDKTSTALTRELIDNGIAIHFDDSIDVPKDFSLKTLVIITPAVPSTHSEWNYFIEIQY
jgi:UDP-N-acetylmuramate--alanine ligase